MSTKPSWIQESLLWPTHSFQFLKPPPSFFSKFCLIGVEEEGRPSQQVTGPAVHLGCSLLSGLKEDKNFAPVGSPSSSTNSQVWCHACCFSFYPQRIIKNNIITGKKKIDTVIMEGRMWWKGETERFLSTYYVPGKMPNTLHVTWFS